MSLFISEPNSFSIHPLFNDLFNPQVEQGNLNRLGGNVSPANSQLLAPFTHAAGDDKSPLKLKISGSNKRIVGTNKNDVLDASKGKGNNTLLGKRGNDRLKGKKKDKLLAGPGNDRLDTRKGSKNILKGGGGNDIFFVGKKDKASGGGGADTLNALKGKGQNTLKGGGGNDVLIGKMGDRLIGGPGDDKFVLAKRKLPQKRVIVKDFQQGRDRLAIQNVSSATVFSDLTLTQQKANTLITIQGQAVALLENFTATELTSDDIDGIAPTPGPAPSPTPGPTPSPVQISVADDEVFEGNPGDANQVTFVVSLNRPAEQDVTITYQTTNTLNEATSNVDYVSTQGTLTIPAGSTARPIDVPIIEDLDDEDDERFALELVSANGASILDGLAVGLIKDDEDDVIDTQQGNTYSLTSIDALSINAQFQLSGLDDDGNAIPDTNPNSLAGFFEGAIKNYQSGSGTLPPGIPNPFEPNGAIAYSTVNLRARYLVSSGQDPVEFGGRDTIEYAFITPDNQIIRVFRLDFDNPFSLIPETFDQNLAINSLPYIIENDILKFMTAVEFNDVNNQWFISGGSRNTQPSKTYSKVRTANGMDTLASQFTLVSGYQEQDISDEDGSPIQGSFSNAIANYSNTDLALSFAQGNLTTKLTGNVAQYTLNSTDSSASISASINLASTSLNSTLAINDIQYILDNDILKLVFFSTQ